MREVRLTIPMVPDMEVAAVQTAEAVLRFMAFGEEQIDEVKHALVEGCINAFEHGQGAEGNVHIRFVMDEAELLVEIQDYGPGFTPEAVPRPVEGSATKRGWGLALMERLMDGVAITSGPAGTQIRMTKRRQP